MASTELQGTGPRGASVGQAEASTVPDDIVARLSPVVLEVFSSGDFHRVDMRTIARSASMSFKTIYRYFSDKEKLLFWFIAYWLRDLEGPVLAALEADGPPLARMRESLLAHLRYYEANPAVGRIIFMTVPLERWMQDATFHYRAPTKKLLAVIEEGQLRGDIRGDVRPQSILDLLSGTFNRAFLMWEFRGRAYSLPAQGEEIFALVLHGITSSDDNARTEPSRRASAAVPQS